MQPSSRTPVGVGTAMAALPTVTLSTAQAAPHAHPETRLADVARIAAVDARTRLPRLIPEHWFPDIRAALSSFPARVVPIDGIPRHGVDEVAVRAHQGDKRSEEQVLHHGRSTKLYPEFQSLILDLATFFFKFESDLLTHQPHTPLAGTCVHAVQLVPTRCGWVWLL